MTAQIIDGLKIAESLQLEVVREVKELEADGIACGMATLLIGADYSSRSYERRLKRIADQLGMPCWQVRLPGESTQDDVLAALRRLNGDPAVSGILVLRPLPEHISEVEVFRALSPLKDIESVHPENAGLLALGRPRFYVLDEWLDQAGENRSDFYHRSLIVVVGRSNNVGKPAVSLAYDRQAAVESVDEWASQNHQLGRHTRRADVLIVAAGVRGLISSEHIREGAVVLDVGINPVTDPETGTVRIVGDVNLADVAPRARAITPVPGGIGPVTDLWLLRNTVSAARNATQAERPSSAAAGASAADPERGDR